jgi:hypothetical protein
MKANTDFIERSKIMHNNKYDYSEVIYVNNKTKVKIGCPIHGFFEQVAQEHLRGAGCPRCGFEKSSSLRNKIAADSFIERAIKKHNNKYDYSETVYINNQTKVKIGCPIHGIFEMTPNTHMKGKGNGCPKCKYDNLFKTTEEFIMEATAIHGERYDYSETIYISARTKVKIRCRNHGEFYQRPFDHLNGCGCRKCNRSKGENSIEQYLIEHNIRYIPQYYFPDCKYLSVLYFDFYLPDLHRCVEFDGRQHYVITKFFGGEEGFKLIQARDSAKNKYCIDNNIPLLRIKQDEDVIKKLDEFLK